MVLSYCLSCKTEVYIYFIYFLCNLAFLEDESNWMQGMARVCFTGTGLKDAKRGDSFQKCKDAATLDPMKDPPEWDLRPLKFISSKKQVQIHNALNFCSEQVYIAGTIPSQVIYVQICFAQCMNFNAGEAANVQTMNRC